MEDDYDYEYRSTRGRSTTRGRDSARSVRATSVFPATLKHFDDLNKVGEEDELTDYGYGFSNAGLHRARRALSEARIIARDISQTRERESSLYESMEKSHSKKTSMSLSQSQSEGTQGFGNYKITVTPRAETWSSFPGRGLWSSRSITSALLAKYSPNQFPDFIFGTIGANNRLNEPISSTRKYYAKSVLDDEIGNSVDTSALYSKYNNASSSLSSQGRSYALESTGARDILDSSYDLDTSLVNYEKSRSDRRSRARMDRYDADSAATSFYDGMAKAHGLTSKSSFERGASVARNRSDTAFEPDEAARGYFDKYAVDLEEKAKKYYNDDEDAEDYLPVRSTRAQSGLSNGIGVGLGFGGGNGGVERGGPGTRALRIGDKYYEYPDSTRDSTNIVRPSPLSKFYHYYIPKHYSATPMLGGFMVPAGTRDSKYGWKY